MAGFNDDANALRSDFFLDRVRNLAGQALLNLEAPCESVHQTGDLAKPQDALVREIGYMRLAKKRQQVMFAKAEELDVLHDDHVVVGHVESRSIQYMIQVLVVAAGQKFQRLLEALRRFSQALAIGILADELDDLAHVAGDPARIDFLFLAILIVQQDFFHWLGHGRFPSRLSPVYSKLLFPVSWTRMRSSLAWGKVLRRSKISMHK